MAARSQMALTQILQNPDELSVHAEVPNEKCADCHVEGDPEKWAIVAASAGHRAGPSVPIEKSPAGTATRS